VRLRQHLRSFDKTTELVVLTESRNVRDMAVDKSKYDIHSFLQTPIDVKEFFGFHWPVPRTAHRRPSGNVRRGGKSAATPMRR